VDLPSGGDDSDEVERAEDDCASQDPADLLRHLDEVEVGVPVCYSDCYKLRLLQTAFDATPC